MDVSSKCCDETKNKQVNPNVLTSLNQPTILLKIIKYKKNYLS